MQIKLYGDDLEEKLQIFENKDIIVEFDDFIEGKFEMKKVHIEQDSKTSYLYITDKSGHKLGLNIGLMCKIELDGKKLSIVYESCINIYITII